MSEFICLYNFNGVVVLYKSVNNVHDMYQLIYMLNIYINKNVYNDYKIYIITNIYNENVNMEFIKDKNIYLLKTNIYFTLFYNLHQLRHDYFYKNNIAEPELIFNIFNNISVPFDKYPNSKMYSRSQWFINNLNNDLSFTKKTINNIKELNVEIYDKIIKNTPIENIDSYNELLLEINMYLIENIDYLHLLHSNADYL